VNLDRLLKADMIVEPVTTNRKLPKYSLGVGDRFAHEAEARLAAFEQAAQAGVEITPVWNKSNREHVIIGSEPSQTRAAAVNARSWKKPYFCDADTSIYKIFRASSALRFLHHRCRRPHRQIAGSRCRRGLRNPSPALLGQIDIDGAARFSVTRQFLQSLNRLQKNI
jgi:hypothetical protein